MAPEHIIWRNEWHTEDIKALDKQIERLKKFFPNLDLYDTKKFIQYELLGKPKKQGVSGSIIIPKPETLAQDYAQAVPILLNILGSTGAMIGADWFKKEILNSVLTKSRTLDLLREIKSAQPGETMILPYRLKHCPNLGNDQVIGHLGNGEFELGIYESIFIAIYGLIKSSANVICAGNEKERLCPHFLWKIREVDGQKIRNLVFEPFDSKSEYQLIRPIGLTF